MQTFLPRDTFSASALILDRKRLNNQQHEGLVLLRANTGRSLGYANHPAAVMWRGHDTALFMYVSAICREWEHRGFSSQLDKLNADFGELASERFELPWWMGWPAFHRSHESNLQRKAPEHYGTDLNALPYIWPGEEPGTYREKYIGEPWSKWRVTTWATSS